MTTNITPNNFKYHNMMQFIESFNESANTAYYLFVGKSKISNTGVVDDINDCEDDINLDVYNNLIAGKRVSPSDVAYLIRNIPWTSNTIYSMYDHTDVDLSSKDFFVNVQEGSFSHVYKCLDNNLDTPSTSQPTFAHVSGANTQLYRTSDGYAWKYMYSFDSAANSKFSTTDFIPVVPNTSVSSSAIPNQIDVIKVEGAGRKFDNYLNGTFSAADIAIDGNTQIYQISNTDAKNVNNFYTSCLLYLSSGVGAGQYSKIINYYSNSTGKYVVIDEAFHQKPTNSTQFQINPSVVVSGQGHETANVVARALINALSTNSVYRVELFEKGSGFESFATAKVLFDDSVNVQADAELKVILSPYGGHGYDAGRELYSNTLEISIQLANTENNTIPAINQFQQVGLMKNPLFANVGVVWSSVIGTFQFGERVWKIEPSLICGDVNANSTANTLDITLDAYNNQLKVGDKLFFNDENLGLAQITTLVAITNSSQIQISSNALFTSTHVNLYKANPTSTGVLYETNTSAAFLDFVNGELNSNDLIVGEVSGAVATVNNIVRGDMSKGFETFVGMYGFTGTVQSGSFQFNETLYQGDINNANAIFHSISTANGLTKMYITDQENKILFGTPGRTIIGDTSGAIFTPDDIRYPEIKFGSGQVLYIENVEPVTRSANTKETIQFIFNY